MLFYQKNSKNQPKKKGSNRMEYNSNNVFAKILRGEIEIDKIYEDDYALAFYDIAPKAKVHALVISKAMVVDFADFVEHSNAAEIEGYMRAIVRTAEKLNLIEDGYRLVFNSGKNSGQEVPHLHAHILGGEKLSVNHL